MIFANGQSLALNNDWLQLTKRNGYDHSGWKQEFLKTTYFQTERRWKYYSIEWFCQYSANMKHK
jgi:hypothetical protein